MVYHLLGSFNCIFVPVLNLGQLSLPVPLVHFPGKIPSPPKLMLHARPTTAMVTRLFPFSHSLTSPFLSPPLRLFPKPLSLSLLPSATTTLSQSFSYGPSLHKGHKPSHLEKEEETEDDYSIDKEFFTRVYDIAALRVPSDRCFALESRLRGHLLNWPRIRNIARVPNDEMEDEFKNLIGNRGEEDDDSESLVSLDRRIHGKGEGDGDVLSPVLYRDKLARTFDSRGYVRFRNLAKMSRPPKKKRREREGEGRGRREREGGGRSEVYVVEVVEEEEEDMSGLLGEEFIRVRRKWRGSTRLLLLDERCAGKRMEELPEAIKVSVVPKLLLLFELIVIFELQLHFDSIICEMLATVDEPCYEHDNTHKIIHIMSM